MSNFHVSQSSPNYFGSFPTVQLEGIACLGVSRAGLVTIVILAERWPWLRFYIVDTQNVIDAWNARLFNPHLNPVGTLYEEDLDNSLFNQLYHISFTANTNLAITSSQIIFIAKDFDLMEGNLVKKLAKLEIGNYQQAFKDIRNNTNVGKIIIELENISPNLSINCLKYLSPINGPNNLNHTLIACPTMFSQGTALVELRAQRRFYASLKLGGILNNDNETSAFLNYLYAGGVAVNLPILVEMFAPSTLEISMLAVSNVLANKICVANVVSSICGERNANFHQVSMVMAADPRINEAHLVPGVGFGGRTMVRDVPRLCEMSNDFALGHDGAKFLNSSLLYNKSREKLVVGFVVDKVGSLMRQDVVLLGFSMKPDTNDTTAARSVDLAKHLLDANNECRLRIYDPAVNFVNVQFRLRNYMGRITFNNNIDIDALFGQADIIIVVTPWNAIHHLFNNANDRQAIWNAMQHPATFINIWPAVEFPYQDLRNLGFHVHVLDSPRD